MCSMFEERGQSCFITNGCWGFMKGTMISAAKKVFARTNGQKKHNEICWWNEEV